MQAINNFLDEQGRVNKWPAKKQMKIEVVKYIASKFEEGKTYTEQEVNQRIDQWHTYGDYFMLRRGMIDYKLLGRERDGSAYWKIPQPEERKEENK